MGKIKKILENELVGGTQGTDVYPVTSTKAVYNEDNKRLDDVLRRNMPINISTEYNNENVAEVLTLSQSVNKVVSKDRTLGFQGKYLSADGWHTIIYTGSSLTTWTDSTKWIDLDDKIFNSISKNATFAGIATPTTNPGTPDGPVFYIATELGDYSNFGGINIEEGEATILEWDNRVWSKRVTGFATQEKLSELEKKIGEDYVALEVDYVAGGAYDSSGNLSISSGKYTNEIDINNIDSIKFNGVIGSSGRYCLFYTGSVLANAIPETSIVDGTVVDTSKYDKMKLSFSANSEVRVTAKYKGLSQEVDKLKKSIDETDSQISTLEKETVTRFVELESELNVSPVALVNLFDKDNSFDGYMIVPSTGTMDAVSEWSASDFINVSGMTNVVIMLNEYNKYCHYAFYNSSKGYISGGSALSKEGGSYVDRTIAVPTNAVYMRVSMMNKSVFMLVNYANYSSGMEYTPFGVYSFKNGIIKDGSLSISKVRDDVIELEVGAGKAYTNFQSALAVANADVNNKYRIKVYEGTYDVFSGQTFDATSIGYNVSNLEIVGIGNKENIVLYGYLSNDIAQSIRDRLSIFNIRGTFFAKNITISAKNIRYTIHDDYEEISGKSVTYEDCILKGDSMTHNNIYGCGLWNGTKYTFTRCTFAGTTSTFCYGFHTIVEVAKAKTPSDVVFNDCEFLTDNSYWCTFGSSHNAYKDNVTFNGCSFVGSIYPTGTDCMVNIKGSGNSDLLLRDGTTNKNCLLAFGDTTIKLLNNSGTTISKGKAIKRNGWNACAICGTNDIFIGVALEDIPNGGWGLIQTKGILPNSIMSCSTGQSISNNNGTLEIGTSNIIGKVVFDNFIKLL